MAIAEEQNESSVIYPSEEFKQNAHISSMDTYRKMYKRSVEDPEGFWSDIAQDFYFKEGPKGSFLKYNLDIAKGPVEIKWMEGAVTNICYNVLDRNIEKGLGDRVAYIWEGSETDTYRTVTYSELRRQVCKFSNVLKGRGVKKGDRVALYMPVTIELVIGMLSCARIGAIHSVVFAGFSGDSIADRIMDCGCKILITCDGVYRGQKFIPLKEMADDALAKCAEQNYQIVNCIVYHHLNNGTINGRNSNGDKSSSEQEVVSVEGQTIIVDDDEDSKKKNKNKNNLNKKNKTKEEVVLSNGTTVLKSDVVEDFFEDEDEPRIPWNPSVDVWWHELMDKASDICEPVWVDAEDPLFILYTSGSTGKPKGVLHTTGGYMIYAATTFKYVFNYVSGDVFFCTADLGWITGHTVNCYGSLANGATIVLFDGTPFYPSPDRLWEMVDRYSVNTFYTAPTAIRALMKYGDTYVRQHKRTSLRLLGTAGEPINPEAWSWYYNVIGNGRCPIVDTFWQTETAAPMLSSLPGCTPMKPGSATYPFFGVVPAVVNDEGKELQGPCAGHLVFKNPWPAIMRTVDGNHRRYETTYFQRFPGYYNTGDGVRRDKDGYYWVTGRTDDLLNVSGHLLSTAEVESALVEHKSVAETAAISTPHPLKGECIYCFIVLKNGYEFTRDLESELKQQVRTRIGAIASPEVLHLASALPKTRSGKIMRRLLRKVASDERDLGDVSSLADDAIIDELFSTRALYVRY